MVEISIIIPCYNLEKYIAECLDSVLEQTFSDFEVILIDDGSTDNSLKIIEEYINKDNRIKLVKQENKGVVVARNNAIKCACGTFIYPLDGDDKIAPNCLEILHKVITTTKNRVVASEVYTFGASVGFFNQPRFNKLEMYGLHENCVISGLFYKSDFEKFGGYKEEFNGYGGDDMDYWLNYLDNNLKMRRVPQVLFYYRLKCQEESMWRNYTEEEFLKRQEFKNSLLRKNHKNVQFYERIYKLLSIFVRNHIKIKITKSKRKIIKVFGIPVYWKKVK